MKPFPYQLAGAAFLAERKRALLADDMGLGKSAQAILACRQLCPDHQWIRVVVVSPASVVANWRREFDKFWSTKDGRAYLASFVSYDMLTRQGDGAWKTGTGNDVGRFAEIDVLILDEAHYLKTKTAKRTKAIFGERCDGVGGLVERAKHVFLLTGTPAPNNPSELWPMLRAVLPEAIAGINGHPMSYWSFVSRYCRTRDNGFGIQIVGGKNLEKLKVRLAPHVLRRKKEEVLQDLPPIRFDELAVEGGLSELGQMQSKTMSESLIRKTLEQKGVEGLREIAPHVAQLRRLTGLAKVKGCIDWITDWLGAGGDKLVVFAHHRDVIDGLFHHFALNTGYRSARLTGDTPAERRQLNIDYFQKRDANLFFGQIQAAGTGITLTAASDALFVESSWVPAENEQAAMRIHRIGQRNACLVRFAMLAGSIDEQIQRAVMRKSADIAKLFS